MNLRYRTRHVGEIRYGYYAQSRSINTAFGNPHEFVGIATLNASTIHIDDIEVWASN